MPNYLLEIGTEELPAGHVSEAQEKLEQLLSEALKEKRLSFDSISSMSTPRRLAVLVSGLTERQETTTNRQKGPPAKSSFDESGKPTRQAQGFADKWGVSVDKLEREEIGGTEYIIASVTIEGKKAADVLREIMPRVISQISGERLMRWGSYEIKFSRPIRWLVSLLDAQVVDFQLENLTAGRTTVGHRILAPKEITLFRVEDYEESLKKAKVLVDPAERRRVIEKEVSEAARSVKGVPRQLSGSLLDEVVNLTEWPSAVVGEFGKEYLELPDTLIETIMVHHQRYFPIERQPEGNGDKTESNALLPYFVTISNNDRQEARDIIKKGNERVIRARLADGRFFYFDDQKKRLSERRDALEQLTFQEGLGNYLEKSRRLVKLAREIIDALALDAVVAMCFERTADLCKLDLVTNLVRELPELQGYVGSWYAEKDGEPPDVVRAIASHYSPRHTDDQVPPDTAGKLTSVIDKLDNIVGLFSLGKKPSGSSDPYALRRQAQGLIDILVDGLADYPINASSLIELLTEEFAPRFQNSKKGFDRAAVKSEVSDFILQRLHSKLVDRGFRRESIDAVLSAGDALANIPDVIVRLECIESLISSADGLDLARVGVRVRKIVSPDDTYDVEPGIFSEDAEKELWQSFRDEVASKWQGGASGDVQFKQPESEEDYKQILKFLKPLVAPVDRFFEKVMVNDEDLRKRANRHALLMNIDRYFSSIADFSKLKPLLP